MILQSIVKKQFIYRWPQAGLRIYTINQILLKWKVCKFYKLTSGDQKKAIELFYMTPHLVALG